jgi:hypothetical protein
MLSELPGELQDLQAICQRLENWERKSGRGRVVGHAIQELVRLCRTTIQQCALYFADSQPSSQDGLTDHPLLMFEGLTLQGTTRPIGSLDYNAAFLENVLDECKLRIQQVVIMLDRILSRGTEELQLPERDKQQEESIFEFARTLDEFRNKWDDDLWKSTSLYTTKKMIQLRMDSEANMAPDFDNFMEYLLKCTGRNLRDNSSLSDTDAARDELYRRFARSL